MNKSQLIILLWFNIIIILINALQKGMSHNKKFNWRCHSSDHAIAARNVITPQGVLDVFKKEKNISFTLSFTWGSSSLQ